MDQRDYGRRRLDNADISDDDGQNHSDIEEAEEDHEVYVDDDRIHEGSSQEEGDNLDDHMSRDYEAIPGLDKYESEGLDEEDYSQISHDARRQADRELEYRDRGKDAYWLSNVKI